MATDGEYIRLVERMVEILNTRSFDAVRELYCADYLDHDPLPGQPPGIDGVHQGLRFLADWAREVRFHLEDCFEGADRVAYRIFGSWTVKPELAFQASLGLERHLQISGVGIFRCQEGRLAERWGPWNLTEDSL